MDKRPGSSSSGSSSSSSMGNFLGKLYPASRHVSCCSGDACNVPDRRLDKDTEVLPAAPKEWERVPSSWRACLTTQQRIGSLVKPKKYSKADGFVACGRFQYKCDSPQARPANVTACSAADVKAGAWQWHYTALTQQQCDRLPVEAAKLGLQHAVCCLTDNCNLPDRTLDSSTEVVRWTGLVTSSNTSTRSG
ncbi:hypothetical protein OEZ85_006761 [Tetradesmus obliquus]|uniref:Uncharacterized protein n=1 Tax=Tetradesmus obliquus TaxID=3088 RepID=A0ABY8TVL4_TETOB|nr:hypothetical protein OEZ85_006761 [Tetradesmus obliquus]